MFKLFSKVGRGGRRNRKPKQAKKDWLKGLLKKIKVTKSRQVKRGLRTATVKNVTQSISYQAFLRSRLFNVILIGVVLYMAFLTGREALVNFYQTKQVVKIEGDNNKIRDKNQEMVYLLEYYKTDTYAELEARKHLNLKKPGENVAIVPVDLNEEYNELDEKGQPIKYRTNYQKWLDFIFADISNLPEGDDKA